MRIVCVTLMLAAALAAQAAAQPAPQRGYVTFNGAFQPASSDLEDKFTFDLYAEPATIDVRYPAKEAIVIDGGFGLRLWKRLGAGLSVSYATSDSTATATGSLPHPFFLDRMRNIEGETSGIARTETAIHVHAVYFVPSRGRWRVMLSGGPSYFSLDQELAREVRYGDDYPHDTATFRDMDVRGMTGTGIGFNAAADIAFMFGRRFGVGGLVRYTTASIELDAPGKGAIDVDAGGVQAGVGVRVLF